jgi:hypothetical protein
MIVRADRQFERSGELLLDQQRFEDAVHQFGLAIAAEKEK